MITSEVFTPIILFTIGAIVGGSLRLQKGIDQEDRIFDMPTIVLFFLYTIVGTSLMLLTSGFTSYVWAVPIAAYAALNLWQGPSKIIKKFDSKGWGSYWMVLRYSVPMLPVLCVLVYYGLTLPIQAIVYMLVLIIGGISYPIISEEKIVAWFEKRYPDFHVTQIGEACTGAAVIGGLALL